MCNNVYKELSVSGASSLRGFDLYVKSDEGGSFSPTFLYRSAFQFVRPKRDEYCQTRHQ